MTWFGCDGWCLYITGLDGKNDGWGEGKRLRGVGFRVHVHLRQWEYVPVQGKFQVFKFKSKFKFKHDT